MRRNIINGVICASLALFSPCVKGGDIKINEIIVDPQQDLNQDGRITSSDEFFELFNKSSDFSYKLKGWKLELIDSTPESITIEDVVLSPRSFYVIQNPKGAQNNDGEIRLYDGVGNLVDSVAYGNWRGENKIPNGNATGLYNGSLSRYPDGSMNWIKTYSSMGTENISGLEIKPKLLIEKINEEERSYLDIEIVSFPPKRFILQQSDNLRDWISVYTNSVEEVSFSYRNSDFENKQRVFYRAVEYSE
ncbi:lamin tail domain-containing protein [Candidatus Pacearchaeota archaeon]|nr:lamin tail domain-containing protein [Candidatus Pacearchaeota archaeon]